MVRSWEWFSFLTTILGQHSTATRPWAFQASLPGDVGNSTCLDRMVSLNRGKPQIIQFFTGFSIINHLFWGTPNGLETPIIIHNVCPLKVGSPAAVFYSQVLKQTCSNKLNKHREKQVLWELDDSNQISRIPGTIIPPLPVRELQKKCVHSISEQSI